VFGDGDGGVGSGDADGDRGNDVVLFGDEAVVAEPGEVQRLGQMVEDVEERVLAVVTASPGEVVRCGDREVVCQMDTEPSPRTPAW
jgi:hypothetical protein